MFRRLGVFTYCHHKPSGQPRVRLNGRDLYLGVYNSPESKEAFALLLLQAARQQMNAAIPQPQGNWVQNPRFKVEELVLQYTLFARQHYGAKQRNSHPWGTVVKVSRR